MRKILYIHHGGALGGAPLSLYYLILALPRCRLSVKVCCLEGGEVVNYFNANGISAYANRKLSCFGHVNGGWFPFTDLKSLARMGIALVRFPLSIWHTLRLLRREKPDLVHLNSSVLTPQAVACKLAGVRFIWHVREAAHPGYLGVRRQLLRWMFRRLPDRVICICKTNAEQLRIPADKRRVVYNFVDFKQFDRRIDGESIRRELRIPPGKKVILYCGGTTDIKGGYIVPPALERLQRLFPNHVCIVSGYMTPNGLPAARTAEILADPQSPVARSFHAFHRLEKDGFVVITGFRTDIHNLLAACDCLIFPSAVSHFARPVMEAACMAKPVVASRFDELAEVVADGKTGILIPPNDAEALATALADLLSDEGRMRAMGEAAYGAALQLFDAPGRVREVLAVYEEVLGIPLRENIPA